MGGSLTALDRGNAPTWCVFEDQDVARLGEVGNGGMKGTKNSKGDYNNFKAVPMTRHIYVQPKWNLSRVLCGFLFIPDPFSLVHHQVYTQVSRREEERERERARKE